jgi:hypothetical protein
VQLAAGGQPVQASLPDVRVLFELRGFLLGGHPSPLGLRGILAAKSFVSMVCAENMPTKYWKQKSCAQNLCYQLVGLGLSVFCLFFDLYSV